ncbi:Abi-domain-containing protein [Sporormia fimetaria CBS 119925]|uniref:intramembrane prenyl-peptidase Rce1 n=1 Tax=Sporormia fimetaria CBS 119925 TaxID=1340428 RepID=A0A6A6UYI6_9PLEO|nr:Abi-domain-containing protein [Sporormia fimetaria CBS 119925]
MAPIHSLRDGISALGNMVKQTFDSAPEPPAISPTAAAILSVSFTLLYILPFYLSPFTRPSQQLHRDAPASIRARTRAVTVSTFLCIALAAYVLRQYKHASLSDTLRLMGWYPVSLVDTARTILLVAILFAGPLFEAGIVDGGWKNWIRGTPLLDAVSSWVGYRNYLVGPLTEELIWRALVIPLHRIAHVTPTHLIFLTPLYFGIAHLHHLYDFRSVNPNTPFILCLLRSLFQFTYTSLFGFFAAFVFFRTGNVWSCFLAHSFCNWLGLPRFWGRVGVVPGESIGPAGTGEVRDGMERRRHEGRGVAWTVAYYVILVAGAVGFYVFLFPLTESARAFDVILVEE